MVAVDGQGDGLVQEPGVEEQGPEQQPPILKTFPPDQAEPPERNHERMDVGVPERGLRPGRAREAIAEPG